MTDPDTDDWERPASWERIPLEELPESDSGEYPLPHPDDLERVPAEEFYGSEE